MKATKKNKEAWWKNLYIPTNFTKLKDNAPALEVVKGKKIIVWIVEDEDLVKILNLGTLEDPNLVKIAKDLGKYEAKVKDLLLQFKNVFAFTYKDMKGIPPYVYEHKIGLQLQKKKM